MNENEQRAEDRAWLERQAKVWSRDASSYRRDAMEEPAGECDRREERFRRIIGYMEEREQRCKCDQCSRHDAASPWLE